MITIYITDNIDNLITPVFLDAEWVNKYSAGFGNTGFGLFYFGDPEL